MQLMQQSETILGLQIKLISIQNAQDIVIYGCVYFAWPNLEDFIDFIR